MFSEANLWVKSQKCTLNSTVCVKTGKTVFTKTVFVKTVFTHQGKLIE